MSKDATRDWAMACLALDLFAIDPAGFGGLHLRARAGPVRDAFLERMGQLVETTRIHPATSREALLGGLDLTATLTEGRIVERQGLIASTPRLMLAMAERVDAELAAVLAQAMERDGTQLVLLDEGAEPGEAAPALLSERVAFQIDLKSIGRLEARPNSLPDIAQTQDRLPKVTIADAESKALVALAARLGIDSLRAPLFAIRCARAHAALNDRLKVTQEDIERAATLVLAPRATVLPSPKESQHDDPPPPEPGEDAQAKQTDHETLPEDILVEAVRPHLPDDLLTGLRQDAPSRSAQGTGAGQARKSNRRGRPLPSRPGRIGGGARVDLVATLRAAAPWQKARGRDGMIKVLPSDIRVKRFEEKSDRLIIFAVDASGSAAMARLGDAKGAVEILLSQAYQSRDHVALVAFRGAGSDVLLPPTRSLVQAKRSMTGLPGGGGTPLAAGMRAAGELALNARSQGLTPTLILLTDGRANIALDGAADRARARSDATAMARWLRSVGLAAIVLDTANRPDRALAELAKNLAGTYMPLPRAAPATIGKAIRDGLGA